MKTLLVAVAGFLLVTIVARSNCSITNKDAVTDSAKLEELVQSVPPEVQTETIKVVTVGRKERSHATSLRDFLSCLVVFDAPCFLNRAEDLVAESNRKLWVEADAQAIQITGRSDEETKPSVLMKSISQLIAELTGIFKESLGGFLRDAKEADDDEEIESNSADDDDKNEDEDDEDKVREIGEARGKKKKKKKAIIKLLLIGAVLAAKLKLLLKIFATHLQVKFLLIALASLLINAVRLWVDLKKGHEPQKVIYYEHAQHQHHYDGPEEDWHSGWSRSYDEEQKKKSGQDLAYAQQKPQGLVYTRVDDKPNYSWAD